MYIFIFIFIFILHDIFMGIPAKTISNFFIANLDCDANHG